MDDDTLVKQLLEDLQSSDEAVRENATQDLWRLWFNQKGEHGLDLLRRSQMAYELGDVDGAELMLSTLIKNQPDFAEAWNRRAVLRYVQGNYAKSLADCQKVTELNPHHFGAWHGMGLCYAALGEFADAIQAFRKALDIQPYALVNQKLILECTARLD
jgi:tetratricopeptide (TPR) repeat protein